MWVPHVWTNWAKDSSGGRYVYDVDHVAAAHDHWGVAAQVLELNPTGSVLRGTVIQKLWNAVDRRVRSLHSLYHLRELASRLEWDRGGRLQLLEMLARVGLVRPSMLEQLRTMRNTIEHADRGVPDLAQCQVLLDAVWYFLRSTDSLVDLVVESLEFVDPLAPPGPPRFVSVNYVLESWDVTLWGFFDPTHLGLSEQENDLALILDRPPEQRGDGQVCLHGRLGVNDGLEAVIREYFDVCYLS